MPYIAGAGIIFVLFITVRVFLARHNYFDIKYIDVYIDGKPASPNLKNYYHFQASSNIFDTNLKAIEAKLKYAHPEIRNVTVTTCLPDRLRADIISRKPVAQLSTTNIGGSGFGGRSNRYYPVDIDGMVLADVRNEPLPGLPEIIGAEGIREELMIGQKCYTPNLRQAYGLLSQIQQSGFIKTYRLHYIDCSDSKNLCFYIGNPEIEIRVGDGDFQRKLLVLSSMLDKMDTDVPSIRYIDLRFRDPVVGPRLKR
ncbi:MAG: cell division protein FtsQ/DivIB [Candidatus Omnitrophota bacterium]